MPFVQSFSCEQDFSDLTTLVVNDTSTGSDGGLTSRRVYIQKSDGSYLVPTGTTTDYVLWAIGDSSIDIDVLTQDFALRVRVDWMTGSTVTYTSNALYGFTAYAEQRDYNLTQYMAANYRLITNANFLESKGNLRTAIDAATQAVELGGDIVNAQLCLNEAKRYIDNNNLFQ